MERLKKGFVGFAGALLCIWLFGALWFDGPFTIGKGNALIFGCS